MRKIAALGLLLTTLLAGCAGKAAVQNNRVPSETEVGPGAQKSASSFRPADLSNVDRVVVGRTSSRTSTEFTNAEAARLLKFLSDAPATPTGAASPTCYEELELKLYAGDGLLTNAQTGSGECLIVIESENAPRQPSAEAKQLFQSLLDLLADPYMAQFIPYRQALEAARTTKPDATWRLIFLPEVVNELNGTTVPSWVATSVGP